MKWSGRVRRVNLISSGGLMMDGTFINPAGRASLYDCKSMLGFLRNLKPTDFGFPFAPPVTHFDHSKTSAVYGNPLLSEFKKKGKKPQIRAISNIEAVNNSKMEHALAWRRGASRLIVNGEARAGAFIHKSNGGGRGAGREGNAHS
ncbi:unnamed protein product [Leptosia nina]|uniref:Uncharacterized protein n=1 Tax=Leptosia nina TaxID=320188 RepID=A0AAV1J7N5_9NEOP